MNFNNPFVLLYFIYNIYDVRPSNFSRRVSSDEVISRMAYLLSVVLLLHKWKEENHKKVFVCSVLTKKKMFVLQKMEKLCPLDWIRKQSIVFYLLKYQNIIKKNKINQYALMIFLSDITFTSRCFIVNIYKLFILLPYFIEILNWNMHKQFSNYFYL